MPVFDFSGGTEEKTKTRCTYTTFASSQPEASPEKPGR